MIKRDATMIPIQQTEEEEFYTFIGQFYSLNQHILPKEVHVPKILIKILLNQWLIPKLFNHLVVAKRND